MPHISIPVGAPLGLPTNHPPEQRVASPSCTAQPPRLQFCEVTLEEADLMLAVQAWCVGATTLDAEMVEDMSAVDSSAGLRDQLSTTHVLAVPVG